MTKYIKQFKAILYLVVHFSWDIQQWNRAEWIIGVICVNVWIWSREREGYGEGAKERVITVTGQTSAKTLTSTDEADAVFTQTQILAW